MSKGNVHGVLSIGGTRDPRLCWLSKASTTLNAKVLRAPTLQQQSVRKLTQQELYQREKNGLEVCDAEFIPRKLASSHYQQPEQGKELRRLGFRNSAVSPVSSGFLPGRGRTPVAGNQFAQKKKTPRLAFTGEKERGYKSQTCQTGAEIGVKQVYEFRACLRLAPCFRNCVRHLHVCIPGVRREPSKQRRKRETTVTSDSHLTSLQGLPRPHAAS